MTHPKTPVPPIAANTPDSERVRRPGDTGQAATDDVMEGTVEPVEPVEIATGEARRCGQIGRAHV